MVGIPVVRWICIELGPISRPKGGPKEGHELSEIQSKKM